MSTEQRHDEPLDAAKILHQAVEGLPEQSTDPRFPSLDELRRCFPGFVIEERVGAGGMGAVYRARDRKLDRLVAIKVLAGGLADDPAFTERFLREARALASLNHPNVLTVHDFGEVDGLFYLILEYINGVDLRRLMKMGALSAEEALRLAPQICSALQYAHENGVVHRDIKPENILVDAEGEACIADFGLAKLVADDPALATLTRDSQVLGTPHYMAPEQWRGSASVDHRVDIYAVGVVLYEMLTGEIPMGHFALPSERAGTPPRLDEVVRRSLAQEPQQRYDSARAVQEDLEDVRRQLGDAPPPPARGAPTRARLLKRPLVGLAAPFVPVLMAVPLLSRSDQVGEPVDPSSLAQGMQLSSLFTLILTAASWLLVLVSLWAGISGLRVIREGRGAHYGVALCTINIWFVPLIVANVLLFMVLAPFRFLGGPGALLVGLVATVCFLWWRIRGDRERVESAWA